MSGRTFPFNSFLNYLTKILNEFNFSKLFKHIYRDRKCVKYKDRLFNRVQEPLIVELAVV
jgi:hypothetical protein